MYIQNLYSLKTLYLTKMYQFSVWLFGCSLYKSAPLKETPQNALHVLTTTNYPMGEDHQAFFVLGSRRQFDSIRPNLHQFWLPWAAPGQWGRPVRVLRGTACDDLPFGRRSLRIWNHEAILLYVMVRMSKHLCSIPYPYAKCYVCNMHLTGVCMHANWRFGQHACHKHVPCM